MSNWDNPATWQVPLMEEPPWQTPLPGTTSPYVNPQPSPPSWNMPSPGASMPIAAGAASGGRPWYMPSLRNPGRPFSAAGREFALPFMRGTGAKAGLARAGVRGLGYGLLGELGAQGIGAVIPGNGMLEQGLQGAARGAGMFAMGGPWAAAAGGAIGGLSDAFNIPILQNIFGGAPEGIKLPSLGGGEGGPSIEQQLIETFGRTEQALATAGVSPAQIERYKQGMNARLALAGRNEDERQKVLNQMIPQASALIESTVAGPGRGQPINLTAEDIMGIQAMVGNYVQPYAQQYVDTTTQLAGVMNEMGAGQSPAMQQALNAQAMSSVAHANKYAAALQQQAAILPGFSAYQAAIANAYQQPQGGGDFNTLLQQAGAA